MKKGKLVRVQLQPGRFVKMYEQDAIAQGYLLQPVKQKPAAENKLRKPMEDKGVERPQAAEGVERGAESVEREEPAQLDDFTVIDGIGPATARVLQLHGIKTYADLIKAERLNFLREPVQAAIAEWKAEQQ